MLYNEKDFIVAEKLANRAWRLAASIANDMEFGQDIQGSIAELQDVVLNYGTPEDALYFAVYVPGADTKALQDIVIRYGSGWDAYRFAYNVEGADINALQDVVIKYGDGNDWMVFAKDIDGADIERLRGLADKKYGHAFADLFPASGIADVQKHGSSFKSPR